MDIYVMGPDDMPNCPTCQRRLNTDHSVVDIDDDGPIYEGECPDGHGWFKFQVEDE